jgi:RNA polymerase sigma factor (sigma-70 family)
MPAPSDTELLAACIAGDRQAWQAFVRQYTRYVYYLIQLTGRRFGVTLGEDELADLHNDLFLALLEDDRRRLRTFDGRNGCSVRSWVRVITIRRTLDHLRRRRIHVPLDEPAAAEGPRVPTPADDAPDPLERLLARDDASRGERLATLAADLAPADRLLLELIYVRKLPPETIAATLNTSRGAVYTRKTRLIQRLRALAEQAGLLEEA